MMRLLRLMLLGAALAGPAAPTFAQPTPKVETSESRLLARAFLKKIGIDSMMDGIIVATRQSMVTAFQQLGKTDVQAAEITDGLMMPAFRARAPELLARFEDVLVEDFTADELRAVLDDLPNAARQSARTKAGALQARFAAAGQSWGAAVGTDVYRDNRSTFQKLGLDEKAIVP